MARPPCVTHAAYLVATSPNQTTWTHIHVASLALDGVTDKLRLLLLLRCSPAAAGTETSRPRGMPQHPVRASCVGNRLCPI